MRAVALLIGILLSFYPAQGSFWNWQEEGDEALGEAETAWDGAWNDFEQDVNQVEALPSEIVEEGEEALSPVTDFADAVEDADIEFNLEARGPTDQAKPGRSSTSSSRASKVKSKAKAPSDEACSFMRVFGWRGSGEWVDVAGGRVRVRRIHRDGDCLFAALRHQLTLLRGRGRAISVDRHWSIASIRRGVATYLSRNRAHPTVAAQILETAQDDPDAVALASSGSAFAGTGLASVTAAAASRQTEIGSGSADSQLIDTFLNLLANTRSWGGSESIYAFSKLYNVSIRVFNERGRDFKFGDSPEELKICYRRSRRGHHCHYDSVVEVDVDATPEGTRTQSQPTRTLTQPITSTQGGMWDSEASTSRAHEDAQPPGARTGAEAGAGAGTGTGAQRQAQHQQSRPDRTLSARLPGPSRTASDTNLRRTRSAPVSLRQ